MHPKCACLLRDYSLPYFLFSAGPMFRLSRDGSPCTSERPSEQAPPSACFFFSTLLLGPKNNFFPPPCIYLFLRGLIIFSPYGRTVVFPTSGFLLKLYIESVGIYFGISGRETRGPIIFFLRASTTRAFSLRLKRVLYAWREDTPERTTLGRFFSRQRGWVGHTCCTAGEMSYYRRKPG